MYTLSSWRSHLGSVKVDLWTRNPLDQWGPIYSLCFWRSHLGSVEFDFLHQEPARTVGDPFTAYVSGLVTHVPRLTTVHPEFLEKSPGYRSSRLFAPGTR